MRKGPVLFKITDDIAVDNSSRIWRRASIQHCDFCHKDFQESVEGNMIQSSTIYIQSRACDACITVDCLDRLTDAYKTLKQIKAVIQRHE